MWYKINEYDFKNIMFNFSTKRGNSTVYTNKQYLYSSKPSKPQTSPIIVLSNTNKDIFQWHLQMVLQL